MFTDYYFWFAQPPINLTIFDRTLVYLFAVLFIVSLLLWIMNRFIKHAVVSKLVRKFMIKDLTVGSLGLVWAGMRYENTPIFAKRLWAGLVLAILLIWILYILKYILFNFRKEKKEYDDYQLRSKYIR